MSKGVPRILILVTGLGLSGAWLGEAIAHRRSDQRYREARKAGRQLELQNADLASQRERLAGSLGSEHRRVEQISQTLSSKESELQAVIGRLSEEEHVIQQLQGELVAMQQRLDLIQAPNRQARGQDDAGRDEGMVQLEKVVVRNPASSSDAGLQGRILSVHPEWQFTVIDLGWDSVNIGDVVSIYRDEQLVGKARVDRVQEQVSAATLLPGPAQADIHVNDVVRAL